MYCSFRHASIVSAALVFGFSSLPTSAGPFSVVDLGVLGTHPGAFGQLVSDSGATAINDVGQVVGFSSTSETAFHVFLYQRGVMHDLGATGGYYPANYATSINASGQVVGWSGTGGGPQQPVRYNGVIQPLGALPGGDGTGQAFGINDAGVIVGSASAGPGQIHAFRYQGGTMQDLGALGSAIASGQAYRGSQAYAINAAGQIVGVSTVSLVSPYGLTIEHAFLYQNGAMTDLGTLGDSSHSSAATAINASGQVAGYFSTSTIGGPYHAFLYDHGQMHDLGLLNGDPSSNLQATGINDQGQIVGSGSAGNSSSAFLYENGHMYDLNDLIPRDSGWKLYDATGINDLGQIVGDGVNSQGQTHAFLLTPDSSPTAPEPGTLALLSVGAVALGGYGWRRRGHLPIFGRGSHGE
jgi:probable HAF family extracellular repeat protein